MRGWLLLSFGLLLLATPLLAAPVNCEFKTSCTGDEIVLLKAENDTGGFTNAHVAIANNTNTYTYSLCCESDPSHILSNECSNTSTTTVLRASGVNNSHVQIPDFTNYPYGICMGSTFGELTCEYVNGTCTGDNDPVLSMASSGANNATNAHIGNYSDYRLNVCCTIGKEPPQTPVLLYPTDANSSVFERNVTLNWTEPFEPDGDAINYNLSLNVSAVTCSVEHQETGLSTSSFLTDELCTDQEYTWSVQACDVDGCSSWATPFTFTVASTLGIQFNQNVSTFASLLPLATNDTEAGPGQPMNIENTGNIVSDVELNASGALFNNAALDTQFFQFKGAENETGAYASAQTTYANVSATMTNIFTNLSYVDAQDDALIHYRVTVPASEPAGTRSTTINVRVVAS